MGTIKAIFYTVLGWAIGVPTSFFVICRFEQAAGIQDPFLCNPPIWFMLFTVAILLPLSIYGDFLLGRWAWSKSKLGASLFAMTGIATLVLMR